MKKQILIIYASVGLGHKVVAENIGMALEEKHEEVEVKLLDILKLYHGPLVRASTAIYTFIIKKFPKLWGFFYLNKAFQKLALPLRIPLASRKAKKLYTLIRSLKPDLVLTTHPTATALVSYLKRESLYTQPLVTTFSDFHFQPFWVYPRVDHYLVMTEPQKKAVVKFGFDDRDVTVTGLPVHSAFLKKYKRAEILKKYGLRARDPIILLMGGSRGWGVKREDILALLAHDSKWQVVVVTGTDATLGKEFEGISKNLTVFSNWSNSEMAKLFSIAKILITKPGGLSSGQAVVNNLPMVLIRPLPTMEEMNQDYLTKAGVALAAPDSKKMVQSASQLISDEKLYRKMQGSAKAMHMQKAAKLAAQKIIDILFSSTNI